MLSSTYFDLIVGGQNKPVKGSQGLIITGLYAEAASQVRTHDDVFFVLLPAGSCEHQSCFVLEPPQYRLLGCQTLSCLD